MATVAGSSLANLFSPEGLLAQAREKAKPFNLKIKEEAARTPR